MAVPIEAAQFTSVRASHFRLSKTTNDTH